MHHQSRQKREGASPGADGGGNEPGPSQAKTRKKSSKNETKSQTVTGSKGHQTSLQRGKNDAMFGHYWCRLEIRIKKDSQSGASSSISNIAECSSSDDCTLLEEMSTETSSFLKEAEDIEYKKTEAECAVATSFASSSAETYTKYMNVLEQNIECKTGVPFQQQQAEPQGVIKELLLSLKVPSGSKEPLLDKPLDLTVKKKTSDQHISTPNTEPSGSESKDIHRTQFSQDMKRNKETKAGKTEPKIDVSGSLHCGSCDADFGPRATVLGKLMFRDKESCLFKCLCCSKLITRANFYKHIISHLKNDKLFCKKCQTDSEYGKVIYDLETTDFSKQDAPSVEMQQIEKDTKIPKLTPKLARALSEMRIRCGVCKNPFSDVSKKLQRMYQCSDSFEVKDSRDLYCCIICGMTRTRKSLIDNDLLSHFQSKAVFCQTCYDKAPLQNVPEIKLIENVSYSLKERLRVFDPSINIVCKKCETYLADSAVLNPQPLMQYVKTIQGDDLKLSTNLLYKCLICCDPFDPSDIKSHIAYHINSDHLACRNCFAEDQKSIVILERISYCSAPSRVNVLCKKCGEYFRKEDLESRFSGYALRTPFQKREARVHVCEVCKRSFQNKRHALNHIKKHISKENIFCSCCTNKEEKETGK